MLRRVITDSIWVQLQGVMKEKGCHRWTHDREVFEAILWKLRTGAPWRDVPEEFCPWKTAYNRFNRWATKGLWEDFFLCYEAKLIRNGYSSMEVMSALTSMRAELGLERSEPSEDQQEEQQLKFTLPPMRMEIRSILKSLGVKFTMSKPRQRLSKK